MLKTGKMFQWNILYFIQIITIALGQQMGPRPSSNRYLSAKRLGDTCRKHDECRKNDFHSFCTADVRWESQKTCQCTIGFKNIEDECVEECQYSVDCFANDINSFCKMPQYICYCSKPYVRMQGKCVAVKKLGQPCSNSDECKQGTLNSYCIKTSVSLYRTCQCLPNYPYFNEKCQKVAHYDERCNDNSECMAADPNSICQSLIYPLDYRSCVCSDGFIYSQNTNQCKYDFNLNNNPPSKRPMDTAGLTAIIGTVTCVGVLLVSIFLCAYRQRRESRLRSRRNQTQVTADVEESLPVRDSTLRRSIRSFLSRLGPLQAYTDPPPPYDLVVAQKTAINNQDNPPEYNDIFQTSQEHSNRAFIPDPGPSHNI